MWLGRISNKNILCEKLAPAPRVLDIKTVRFRQLAGYNESIDYILELSRNIYSMKRAAEVWIRERRGLLLSFVLLTSRVMTWVCRCWSRCSSYTNGPHKEKTRSLTKHAQYSSRLNHSWLSFQIFLYPHSHTSNSFFLHRHSNLWRNKACAFAVQVFHIKWIILIINYCTTIFILKKYCQNYISTNQIYKWVLYKLFILFITWINH